MTPLSSIHITALGTVNPVGLSAQASCAALRAGISNQQEIGNFAVTGEIFDEQPAVGGRVPLEWLAGEPEEELWPGHERWDVPEPPPLESIIESGLARIERLATAAIADLQAHPGWPTTLPPKIGLYLGLDEIDDPKATARLVATSLGAPFSPIKVKAKGRAAGLNALIAAVNDLQEGLIQAAVVCGIDSRIRPEVLEEMKLTDTLRSADNSQGIIPGEGAGFVLLETQDLLRKRQGTSLANVLGMGLALEPTANTEKPNRAEGLTQAVRAAVQPLVKEQGPPQVICDLNGDRYRSLEWAMTDPRTLRHLGGKVRVWHPADCLGDTGAASGLINLIWGCIAMDKHYTTSNEVLVWGASENGTRAAALLGAVGRSD